MPQLRMRLIGGFELQREGDAVEVPLAAQRLLGLLALHDVRLSRSHVADALWPDADEARAYANLRTALWRLRTPCEGALVVSQGQLGLEQSVLVDVRALHDAASAYRQRRTLPDPEVLLRLRGELLPGCWDAWLVFERERIRQEAVQLLEASTRAALDAGERHLAVLLGLAAVECDPLRESANLLAVRVRLACDDIVGAVRHARTYARLLNDEIGVRPPTALTDLMSSPQGRAIPEALADPLSATAR